GAPGPGQLALPTKSKISGKAASGMTRVDSVIPGRARVGSLARLLDGLDVRQHLGGAELLGVGLEHRHGGLDHRVALGELVELDPALLGHRLDLGAVLAAFDVAAVLAGLGA